MSLYSSPFLPATIRRKILHLIARSTSIQDGSTTLITRFGAVTWLRSRRGMNDGDDGMLEDIAQLMYNTCDKERVDSWSNEELAKEMSVTR